MPKEHLSEYEEYRKPDVILEPFVGYKALNIEVDEKGEPQLVSPSFRYKWHTAEAVAENYDPRSRGVTSAGPGFYTRRTPEILMKEGHWRSGTWPSVLAEMQVFGRDTIEEDIGFRSEKAMISAIHEDSFTCESCEAKPATKLIHRKKEEAPLLFCDECLNYVRNKYPKLKFHDSSLSDFFHKLAKRYDIQLRKLI